MQQLITDYFEMSSGLCISGNSGGEGQWGNGEGKVGPLNLHVVTVTGLATAFGWLWHRYFIVLLLAVNNKEFLCLAPFLWKKTLRQTCQVTGTLQHYSLADAFTNEGSLYSTYNCSDSRMQHFLNKRMNE